MKQNKIIEAYKALNNLCSDKLPLKAAFSIYKMKKTLEDNYKFQLDKEREFMDECNGFIDSEGRVTFSNKEDAAKFMDKIKELNDIDSNIEIVPVLISLDSELSITPKDVEALDGFIHFE